MAAPMRSTSQDAGHRARVADPRTTAKADTQASNFEYDDNEWDIGIGNLIIDLDADIEKTNEGAGVGGAMATNATQAGSGKSAAKMAIEHSATVDKGLKMKIKRTKPGTKTSEAKHEIVKSNEQNGNADLIELKGVVKHPLTPSAPTAGVTSLSGSCSGGGSASGGSVGSTGSACASSKRGSSSHRRDKTRDKHTLDKPISKATAPATSVTVAEVNGLVRVSVSQPGPQRPLFPSSTCPGPPTTHPTPAQPILSSSPPAVVVTNSSIKIEPPTSVTPALPQNSVTDECCTSPPPAKKLKTESKDVTDVCIGTSVGTITEPDCLGPCEPGTSVTLEGIVWHETEGGVLVVNVTWRGKTYVGTLLDCTRHDWAPPRFCDSPTSDLDARIPKGRGKRGRAATGSSPSTDLSNFTETRSSVHSKLRNGNIKGRRGGGNGSGSSTAPSSPTPFVPPRPEPNNKRKNRTAEEEAAAAVCTTICTAATSTSTITTTTASTLTSTTTTATTTSIPSVGKKPKISAVSSQTNQNSSSGSPPLSPILLECPEPNCSKKYKHINGLKYHQSHAHGSVDDDDTKDVTSMSENEESNIEAPSPVTPLKSPDKSQDSPLMSQKKENELQNIDLLEVPSQPQTPHSTSPSPETSPCILDLNASVGSPNVSMVEIKSVIKPGVLLYNSPEEFPMGIFSGNKTHNITGLSENKYATNSVRAVSVSVPPEQPSIMQIEQPVSLQSFVNQLPQAIQTQAFEPPTLLIPSPSLAQNTSQVSPSGRESPLSKIAQFKVKPASALMPDDKKERNKLPTFKKKIRKSPANSPHPPQHEHMMFGMEVQNRDEVQSPAYSDISDDGTPVEPELIDKNKGSDKKTESGQSMSHMPQFGMYPFYGQPSYMMPSVQQAQDTNKSKEPEKVVVAEKPFDKDIKKENPEYPQKVIQQHYYNPYGYMPNYSYNMETNFSSVPIAPEEKSKDERLKEIPSPAEHGTKAAVPIPNPIQVPTPGKLKPDMPHKEKQPNDNHQILKESIEMKNQMSSYMYSRPQQQSHNAQRDDDMRRSYFYSEPRRKDQMSDQNKSTPVKPPPPAPSLKSKEKIVEEKKEKEIKHEGVKPTMETQGPPPPPTSQYAYIHPSYMQSPHYGALPFDPNHPVYRGLMVPGPYSSNPYMHPQLPRYHAPEDLSRPPPPTKALDMLQHHAQYYSSHKIHELQERAIKSPTPKTSIASSSPSSNIGPAVGQQQSQMPGCVTSQASGVLSSGGKQAPGDNKDSRSPPPQRHVHTHHHTHVGLGYPMYPAPYGAAVLASQQAAAVTVINPYPPK